MQTRLRYCRRMIFPKTLIGEIMVQLLLSRIRVHVDHVGVSAQLGPWKVLTSSLQENLSALANSSLWIAIMSVIQKNQARDSGCNSGSMNSAFEYILKSGGVMREDDYPYAGTDRGTCKLDKTKIAASVANFSVVSLDEDHIAANLVKNGPLAASINAVYMQTYVGGVSCPYICSRRLDHGVLLMGFGSNGYAPIRLKEKPYWIIKNSWGENWGENGYYKICRGRNICGVDSMVSTVAAVHTTSQ